MKGAATYPQYFTIYSKHGGWERLICPCVCLCVKMTKGVSVCVSAVCFSVMREHMCTSITLKKTDLMLAAHAYTLLMQDCSRKYMSASWYSHIPPCLCHGCVWLCHTHVMTSEVEKSRVPSRPRRQSAFFLWRWCISPPQLSQQRHMQKKRPTTGMRTVNSRPIVAHTRKPIS